jgi:hypothetical protein
VEWNILIISYHKRIVFSNSVPLKMALARLNRFFRIFWPHRKSNKLLGHFDFCTKNGGIKKIKKQKNNKISLLWGIALFFVIIQIYIRMGKSRANPQEWRKIRICRFVRPGCAGARKNMDGPPPVRHMSE